MSAVSRLRYLHDAWTGVRVWRRVAHARRLIRASAVAFHAGHRKRAAALLAQAGSVVAEMRTAIH